MAFTLTLKTGCSHTKIQVLHSLSQGGPMKIATRLILLTVLFSMVSMQAVTYTDIAGLYYRPAIKKAEDTQAASSAKTDPKKIEFKAPVLDKNEKESLYLNILAPLQAAESGKNNSFLNTLKELELFRGEGEKPEVNLLNILDRHTLTTAGHIEFAHILANPVADKATLLKRQDALKKLLADTSLSTQLKNKLIDVQRAESAFLSYWQPHDQVTQDFLNKLYFGRDTFDKNPLALEARARLDNMVTFYTMNALPINLLVILPLMGYVGAKIGGTIARHFKQEVPPVSFKEAVVDNTVNQVKGWAAWWNPANYIKDIKSARGDWKAEFTPKVETIIKEQNIQIARQIAASANTRLPGMPASRPIVSIDETSPAFNATPEQMEIGLKTMRVLQLTQLALKPLSLVGFAAWQTLAIKQAFAPASQTKNATNYLQTRLINVATIVNHADAIIKLIKNTPELREVFTHLKQAEAVFNTSNAELKQLLDLLATDTFKGKASFFSLAGRIRAAHKLMTEYKDALIPLMQLLGEVDAYLSIAQLYADHQNTPVVYSFTSYAQTQKPTLELHNFWNPFINVNTVVPNTISLGNGASQALIVTGSNTGGKSTILKSLLINSLLGHTLTIVPAAHATMSLCDALGSYLHVSDDISSGKSLFKAEVMRAQSLLESLSQLPQGHFGFVVIDELFTGTAADKGAAAAYQVAKRLTEFENVIVVIATHFQLLTGLEKETNGICKNYKVDVYKDENGAIVRPFKLVPGVSDVSIANDILNEEIEGINFGAAKAA